MRAHSIPDCWRTGNTVPLPKSGSFSVPATRFRPIASTTYGLMLTESTFIRRATSIDVPDSPLQFLQTKHDHFRWCFFSGSWYHQIRQICPTRLLSFPIFGFMPFLCILERLSCPMHLLAWITDYFINRPQCTRLGRKIYALLVNNSKVPQWVVFHLHLFLPYIGSPSTSSPGQLVENTDGVAFHRSISGIKDFPNFPTRCLSLTIILRAVILALMCQILPNAFTFSGCA